MFYFSDYFVGFVFMFLCFLVNFILFLISSGVDFFFFRKKKNTEKISSYECGFQPFNDARMPFDIRFYLVSILFLIFDLELIYIVP